MDRMRFYEWQLSLNIKNAVNEPFFLGFVFEVSEMSSSDFGVYFDRYEKSLRKTLNKYMFRGTINRASLYSFFVCMAVYVNTP